MFALVVLWLFTTPSFYQGAVLLKGRAALILSKLEPISNDQIHLILTKFSWSTFISSLEFQDIMGKHNSMKSQEARLFSLYSWERGKMLFITNEKYTSGVWSLISVAPQIGKDF